MTRCQPILDELRNVRHARPRAFERGVIEWFPEPHCFRSICISAGFRLEKAIAVPIRSCMAARGAPDLQNTLFVTMGCSPQFPSFESDFEIVNPHLSHCKMQKKPKMMRRQIHRHSYQSFVADQPTKCRVGRVVPQGGEDLATLSATVRSSNIVLHHSAVRARLCRAASAISNDIAKLLNSIHNKEGTVL